ncbi:MAG: MYG1 family protein [Minisyncoccota bacterium]
MTKIVTHNSTYHADDVFAVAALLLIEPDAEVVRTRDIGAITSADYVVDVGLEYDPLKKRFDHHQIGGAGARDNGIQYASFGLVWKEYGEVLSGGKREALIIDRKLAQPLDAHDNGMPIAEYKYERIREYSVIDFLYSYLDKPDQTEGDLYEMFMKVVSIAKDLLEREINKAKESVRSFDAVIDLYKSAEDKRVIIMDKEYEWQEALMSMPEPVFAVYPRNDGSWGVKCVPVVAKVYGTRRKDFPTEWGGKVGEELQKITGVPDAIFAHRGLFMVAAKTKEGALTLAQKALEA